MRHDPPGFAKSRGARRNTFQASLEQCEQFIKAATDADYATRPLQLFYALSQGSRAVVAASPRIGQDWRVHGHGLSASTEAQQLPDVEVYAKGDGLFQAMAKVLDFQALVPDERISLADLWPLVPESAWAPLVKGETLSAVMFTPGLWPQQNLYGASLAWIRHAVPELCGQDKEKVARHFANYPALKGISWQTALQVPWNPNSFAVSLDIHFDLVDGETPLLLQPESRLVARYGSSDQSWLFIAPIIGSMSLPLHPVLAWWAVLLALSSLARYEPANWTKMIDINSSSHATAVEYLLDDAVIRIPEMLLNILLNIEDPG
ncbi:YaaC family protein [Actinoplanes sp. NPDC020271]|uniref:YaaC family protein n=1 Tax=Actinoplanes sp. NPDC020271 TaxID=3363896 RepID=UPI00378E8B18